MRGRECEKTKPSAPIISHTFQSVCMEIDILLRLVGVMNLSFFLSRPFSFQGRNPYLCDFVKKTKQNNNKKHTHLNVGLYSDIYRPIFFKLGMVIETTDSYTLTLVWMISTFNQGHSYMRNQNLLFPFFRKCRSKVG